MAVFLSANTHTEFTYGGTTISAVVKLRLRDQCYLEILSPLAGLRLPAPGTRISLRWQWAQTLWQQEAVVERVDLSEAPLLSAVLQGEPQGEENRRTRRYQVALPLVFTTGRLGLKKVLTETEDVSVEGLRCQVPKPFAEGSPVDMTISLRGASVRLHGQVLRCAAQEAQDMATMAVRFVQTDTREFQMLRAYLESLP